jgi:hypothetical protein
VGRVFTCLFATHANILASKSSTKSHNLASANLERSSTALCPKAENPHLR